MKLSDVARGRSVICRFDDLDDNHAGFITKEPKWQEDPYDSAKEVLIVMLADKGLTYELRVRSQMVDAVLDAVTAAGAESLEVGGYLSVTFYGYKGQLKLYKATYEPPEDDQCGCGDPREPTDAAVLEFGSDDSGDNSSDNAPPW